MALTKVSTGLISADLASVDLNIDANTLYIDVTNNRVGINNTGPATALDVTGTVSADGLIVTATVPSIQLTDSDNNADAFIQATDGNVRFYADDNNEAADSIITFNIDGSEAARLDANGNVGIGTVSPSALGLQVTKATGVAAGVLFSNAANNWQIATGTTTNHLAFVDNQFAERMRIDNSGNVGIGTVSPGRLVDLKNSADGARLRLRSDNAIDSYPTIGSVEFYSDDNSTNSSGIVGSIDVEGIGTWNGAANSAAMTFNLIQGLAGTTSPVEAMRIDSSGNVGIGTGGDNPTALFEVEAASNPEISIASSAGATSNFLNFKAISHTQQIQTQLKTIDNGDFTSDLAFLFKASGTGGALGEKARLTADGNFLVGGTSVTSPSGGAGPLFLLEGSNPEFIFRDNTGTANNMSMYYINDQLVWYSGSAENLRLTNSGNLTVAGALSKGSGSFRIDHPLPAKTSTHHLVHSFVEGPQADLIYRGKVTLVGGSATVNIDTAAGMTDGTFEVLCTDVQCFTSNESGWTAVKGSVSGNTLTITAQDNTCTDTISWMVVGERQDQHMLDTDWTDENGKVIVEPLKQEVAQLEGAN